ncbi:MAG: hypothetical protein IPP35_09910 [Elusimicrobia bacterium]|nr:hypothetical protein [Elusimicrobiota bacterium]
MGENFTPVLGTEVYAFSSLLFVYLFATFLGAVWYRRDGANGNVRSAPLLIGALAIAGVVPILVNDPRLWTGLVSNHLQTVCVAVALVSLAPFCGVLGYLTPRLIDRHFHDSPSAVGQAYAVNAAGCILGPLAAGFFLLPRWGAKGSWVLLAIPYAAAFFLVSGSVRPWRRWGARGALAALLAIAAFRSQSYELVMAAPASWVLRDHTATVVCTGSGREKQLWVNGFGMTCLTPITKFMAHAPWPSRKRRPKKGW